MSDTESNASDDDTPNGESPETVRFHYKKSGLFRVVCCDGAWGGVTPSGYLLINFYNERQPIPREVVFAVRSDGQIGKEVEGGRQELEGYVREVEVGVEMDLNTAKSLRRWLDAKIVQMESFHAVR